jgi:uncharacterized SAM-dependent methyltransferase
MFAADVADGLSAVDKFIHPRHLHDEASARAWQTVGILLECGSAGMVDRLLQRHLDELVHFVGETILVADLGNGNSRWSAQILRCLGNGQAGVTGLESPLAPIAEDWLRRAAELVAASGPGQPLLLMLLDGWLGNLDQLARHTFLTRLAQLLRPGDHFLYIAGLLKDVHKILAEYDDPAGFQAAFHKLLLSRINRELGGHFNLREFEHHVKWDAFHRRVDLRLVSKKQQEVYIGALGRRFRFEAGEAIRTERVYKFTELELEHMAGQMGFCPVKTWQDIEGACAQVLWAV